MGSDDTELYWVRRELELLEFARRSDELGRGELDRYEELCALERRLLRAS